MHSRPEIPFQIQCVAFLKLLPPPPKGPFWTAVNPIPMTSARLGKLAKDMGQRPGFPDILLTHKEKSFVIELKSKKGALSANQKWCQDLLEKSGVRVFVCKTFSSFVEAIQEITGTVRGVS